MSHVRRREKGLLALRELSSFVDPLRSAGYLASVWRTRSAAARRWRESRSSTTSPSKTSGAITPSGRTTTSGPVRNSGSRWPPLRRQALKRRRWRRQRRLPTLTWQHWPKMKQKSPSRIRKVPGNSPKIQKSPKAKTAQKVLSPTKICLPNILFFASSPALV